MAWIISPVSRYIKESAYKWLWVYDEFWDSF